MPSNTDIRPNNYVLLQGTLVWSRIASHVDGEELKEIQKQRASQGRPAPNRPYTTVTLIDPKIVKSDATKPLTPEEQYVADNRFYKSQSGRNAGHICTTPQNTSRNLPAVYRKGDPDKGENPSEFYQVFIDKEIATGTPVLVLLRTFEGQMGHNGIAMNAVFVLNKEIPFFGAQNADANALRNWGIVIHGNDNGEPSAEKQAEIAAHTEKVAAAANMPIAAAMPEPVAEDNSDVPDITFDPNVQQAISLDTLLDV